MKKVAAVLFVISLFPALFAAQLKTVPGYVSTSIYLSGLTAGHEDKFSSEVSYRKVGEKEFLPALPLIYNANDKEARGVIVNLQENTSYELRLKYTDMGKSSSATAKFRTRSSVFPVAKTIVIDKNNWQGSLNITASGKADGYIRYTAAPGFILDAKKADNAINITANYIILENLTIRNPKRNGIFLQNASNIVIRNCDISNFARVGKWRPDRCGWFYDGKDLLNKDSGISIFDSSDILIERCYIHDTRAHANSWFYAHPAGPKAVDVKHAGAVTMRFNDFIGGDKHRFNDVIECEGNSSPQGGLYRDAEIYGNYLALSNDDGIELEGGECNTRFFRNRIEGTLCAISSGCCVNGPGYIFENLICFPGDEIGNHSQAFKNGHSQFGFGSVRIFNNTAVGYKAGIGAFSVKAHQGYLKLAALNNIIVSNNAYCSPNGLFVKAKSTLDYTMQYSETSPSILELVKKMKQDQHGITAKPDFVDAKYGVYRLKKGSVGTGAGCAIPNFQTGSKVNIGAYQDNSCDLPYRPWALRCDKAFLSFDGSKPHTEVVTLTATEKTDFRIMKNTEFTFFEVTPAQGTVLPGKPFKLTVKILPEKFTQARINRGAFLIRSKEGFSRPVGISADSRMLANLRANDRKGIISGKMVDKQKHQATFEFDIPVDSRALYMCIFTAYLPKQVSVSVDGGKPVSAITSVGATKTALWRKVLLPGARKRNNARAFTFKKGKHKITIHGAAPLKAVLIPKADSLMFAPEYE